MCKNFLPPCPRCGGRIMVEPEIEGNSEFCVLCGYRHDSIKTLKRKDLWDLTESDKELEKVS